MKNSITNTLIAKNLILVSCLFISTLAGLSSSNANAAIFGSSFVPRHQELIARTVNMACGEFASMTVVESNIEKIRIDQGITDVRFTTKLRLSRPFPGGASYFEATIVTFYSDGYDHSAQDWGSYSVESFDGCVFTEQYWAPTEGK